MNIKKFCDMLTSSFPLVAAFLILECVLFFFVDRPVAVYVKALDSSAPHIIHFFRAITDLGKSQWYLWPCGVIALFCGFLSRGKDVAPRWRRLFGYIGARALFLFATIGLSGVVAAIIKPIAGRARPLLWLRDGVYGFAPFNAHGFLWNGMPSGHTTTAFALACSFALFYPRWRVIGFAYALMLAASRVMVDAHYVSDVCAGALLGWLTVRIFLKYGMILISQVIFPIDSPAAGK